MEDTSDTEITVKATGYQWKWKYDYLDEGISFFSSFICSILFKLLLLFFISSNLNLFNGFLLNMKFGSIEFINSSLYDILW